MKALQTILSILVSAALTTKALSDDHGNNLANSTRILSDDTFGVLETAGDEDWFKIVVTVPGMHWIYCTGTTDTDGYLFDSAGKFISNNWVQSGGGHGYNFESSGVLDAGTYYLRIRGGDTVLNTGAYVLSVRAPERAVVFDSPNLEASLATEGEIDYYVLNLTVSGYVWLFTTGSTDTRAYLYDDAGRFVSNSWVDDNSGYRYNFRCDAKLDAGKYYLRVRAGTSGIQTGSYTLSIRTPENSLIFDEPNREASLGTNGDIDLYEIRVTSPGRVWIYSTGSTNTSGELYDREGGFIANSFADTNSGSGSNFLLNGTLAIGTYYLRVEAGDGGVATGAYSLHVRQPATATPIIGSGTARHTIGEPGDLDLFVIESVGGDISFSAAGTTELEARLYNSSGSQLDSDSGADFSINHTGLTTGTFYLLVKGRYLDFTEGGYDLSASFSASAQSGAVDRPITHVNGTGSATLVFSGTGSWTVTGLPAWVTASQVSGNGSTNISFAFAPNLSGSRREATVSIGGVNHVLSQNPETVTTGTVIQPNLEIFPAVILSTITESGARYRIETSEDLVNWSETGIEFIGNGSEMSSAIERTQAKGYFRVRVD